MQTLDQIVREYLIESGETTEYKYARVLQIAISGMRELNMDTRGGVAKIKELEVLPNDTAILPPDYIDYMKIAICDCNGTMYSLGLNKNMCMPKDYECVKEIEEFELNADSSGTGGQRPLNWEEVPDIWETIGENWEDFTPLGAEGSGGENQEGDIHEKKNFGSQVARGKCSKKGYNHLYPLYGRYQNTDNGTNVGKRYGIGGGGNQYGFYKIFPREGRIALQGFCGDKIILEYLGDIDVDEDCNIKVHYYLRDAIKSYIRWIIRMDNFRIPAVEKQMAKQQWVIEKKKAKRRLNNFNLRELVQEYNTGFKLSIKL